MPAGDSDLHPPIVCRPRYRADCGMRYAPSAVDCLLSPHRSSSLFAWYSPLSSPTLFLCSRLCRSEGGQPGTRTPSHPTLPPLCRYCCSNPSRHLTCHTDHVTPPAFYLACPLLRSLMPVVVFFVKPSMRCCLYGRNTHSPCKRIILASTSFREASTSLEDAGFRTVEDVRGAGVCPTVVRCARGESVRIRSRSSVPVGHYCSCE